MFEKKNVKDDWGPVPCCCLLVTVRLFLPVRCRHGETDR